MSFKTPLRILGSARNLSSGFPEQSLTVPIVFRMWKSEETAC